MNRNPGGTGFLATQIKKLSIEVVLLAVIFLLCTWILFMVADMVFEDKSTVFDDRIFSLIRPYINDSNTKLMLFITFFGSHSFLLPANILLVLIFLFTPNYRMHSITIASISLTSTAAMFLLKASIQRQRPLIPLISNVHSYSFPSGHSFSSLVFWGMIAYIIFYTINNRWLKYLLISFCMIITLLIGFSRIYLKLHFASDVIAGFCLGIIWLSVAKWILLSNKKQVLKN